MAKPTIQVVIDPRSERAVLTTLRNLRASAQRRVLRPAVAKAGRTIRTAARRNLKANPATQTPQLPHHSEWVPSGTLRKSLISVTRMYKSGNVVAVIGPDKRVKRRAFVIRGGRLETVPYQPSNIAHLVERGTKPHTIRGVLHPGAKPRPFLKPAFENNKRKVFAQIKRDIRINLMREVERERVKSLSRRGF